MPGTDLLIKAMYMYKINMEKHAKANGGKVTYLNQHTVLWGVQKQQSHGLYTHSYKGVCAGLAITWVRATLKGDDFMKQLNTARKEVMCRDEGADFSQQTDSLFSDVDSAHLEQTNIYKAFESIGKLKNEVELNYPFGSADRHFSKGQFYYLSTSTHAMALFCNGSTVDFYDPNVGVVTGVKKKMIGAYLKDCMEAGFTLQDMDFAGLKERKLSISGFKPL